MRSRPFSSAPRRNRSCQVGPIGSPVKRDDVLRLAVDLDLLAQVIVRGRGLGDVVRVDRGRQGGADDQREQRARRHRERITNEPLEGGWTQRDSGL